MHRWGASIVLRYNASPGQKWMKVDRFVSVGPVVVQLSQDAANYSVSRLEFIDILRMGQRVSGIASLIQKGHQHSE